MVPLQLVAEEEAAAVVVPSAALELLVEMAEEVKQMHRQTTPPFVVRKRPFHRFQRAMCHTF